MAKKTAIDDIQKLIKSAEDIASKPIVSTVASDVTAFEKQVKEQQLITATQSKALDFDASEASFKVISSEVTDAFYDFYAKIPKSKQKDFKHVYNRIANCKSTLSTLYTMSKVYKEIFKQTATVLGSGMVDEKLVKALVELGKQQLEALKAQENYIMYIEELAKKSGMEIKDILSAEDVAMIEEINGDTVNTPTIDNSKNKSRDIVNASKEFYIASDQKLLLDNCKESNEYTEADVYAMRSEKFRELGDASRFVNPHQKTSLQTEFNVESSLVKSGQRDIETHSLLDMM